MDHSISSSAADLAVVKKSVSWSGEPPEEEGSSSLDGFVGAELVLCDLPRRSILKNTWDGIPVHRDKTVWNELPPPSRKQLSKLSWPDTVSETLSSDSHELVKSSVWFGQVSMRTYTQEPVCTENGPVIDWSYDEVESVAVNDFELQKLLRQRKSSSRKAVNRFVRKGHQVAGSRRKRGIWKLPKLLGR